MVLIEFEENGEATIVWAGSHDDYELVFKNSRSVIKKWLRNNNWIKKIGVMKDLMNIKEVENINRLENEFDLQKATLLEHNLHLMIDESPDLKPIRKKLRELIREYEAIEWADFENISDSKIEESDTAEIIINYEQKFINKRKESIRKKLKGFDMTQQDLGVLLGHPKSYMSELVNGVSQFTMKDLVIIHRILGISLKILIPTYLQSDTRERVRESIRKLNKPKLGLRKAELV